MRFLFLILIFYSQVASADFEEPFCKIRICSQNMYNFGSYKTTVSRIGKISKHDWLLRHSNLIRSFLRGRCDLIAMQEILREENFGSQQNLFKFILALKYFSNKNFKFIISDSLDPSIELAYLYNSEIFSLIEKADLSTEELPKFSLTEKSLLSSRGPLQAVFKVNCLRPLYLQLFNLHFKSSSVKGGFDPSGYGFELQRMLQAEFLRSRAINAAAEISQRLPAESSLITILMGDRNSEPSSASAQVLTGQLKLQDFINGKCVLGKSKIAYCQPQNDQAEFISAYGGLQYRYSKVGTFKFGNKQIWLDDILVLRSSNWGSIAKSLQLLAQKPVLSLQSSDHALISLQLSW